MAISISRDPPRGSVLARRVGAWHLIAHDIEIRDQLPPELRMEIERELLRRDPRLWAHPVDMIVRARVIPDVWMKFGEGAAKDLMKYPELERAIAANVQELAKATASASERARKPETNTPRVVAIIVIMEFLEVKKLYPQASLNRHYEITGANLGGPGYAIDRGTIRRIVTRNFSVLFPPSDIDRAVLALEELQRLWAILGWGPARKAG